VILHLRRFYLSGIDTPNFQGVPTTAGTGKILIKDLVCKCAEMISIEAERFVPPKSRQTSSGQRIGAGSQIDAPGTRAVRILHASHDGTSKVLGVFAAHHGPMKASATPALRSAATWTFMMAESTLEL
jgi:hypothetical protein